MTGFIWLIVLAVCLVIEIATYGLVTIWFAGGALVTFFVSLLTDNLAVQIVIFLVVSLIMLIFTRPIAMKLVNGKRTRTNVDSVIGKICKVTETIDNFNVALEVDNVATIKELVIKNLGISILPRSVCISDVKKGKISILPIENLSMMREVNIAYNKDFTRVEILKEMVQLYQSTVSKN